MDGYHGNKVYLLKQNWIKNEDQHLPHVDVQACPHACLFLLDLLSSDVDNVPNLDASCCAT